MNLKKILAAVAAGALAVSTMAFSAFAVDEEAVFTNTATAVSTGSWWSENELTVTDLIGTTDPESITKIVFEGDNDFLVGYKPVDGDWAQTTVGKSAEVTDVNFSDFCVKLCTNSGSKYTANITWTVYAEKAAEPSEPSEPSEETNVANVSYGSPYKTNIEADGKATITLGGILAATNDDAGWNDWCTFKIVSTDANGNKVYAAVVGASAIWGTTVDDMGTEDKDDDIVIPFEDSVVMKGDCSEDAVVTIDVYAGGTLEVIALGWDSKPDQAYIAVKSVTYDNTVTPADPTVPTIKANLGTNVKEVNKLALIDEKDKDTDELVYQSILTGTDVKFTDVYGVRFTVTVGEDTKTKIENGDWLGGGMGFNSETTGWEQNEWSFQDGAKDITAVANEDGTYTFTVWRETAVFGETDTYAQVWFQNWSTTDFTFDKVELLGAESEAIFVIENDANADVPGTVKTEEPTEPTDPTDPEEPTDTPKDETPKDETPKDDVPATGIAVAFAGLALAGTAVVATKKRK